LPFFTGGVGNARWAGAPLAPLLKRAGVLKEGIEVVFWGEDAGEVTVRDNFGVLDPDEDGVVGPRGTGTVVPDGAGGLDLTIKEQFARSMTLEDALNPANILCYEMNGRALPPEHGYPVRLIAPGWYGVANVKWLTRIEVWDQQYRGHFMARDYVTIREERRRGRTVWTFANVRHARLKSAPAKVTRRGDRYRVIGAAWGRPDRRRRGQDRRRPLEGGAARAPAVPGQAGTEARLDVLVTAVGQPLCGRAHRHVAGDRRQGQRPARPGRSLPRRQGHVLGEQRPDHAAGAHPGLLIAEGAGRAVRGWSLARSPTGRRR
jgi:DMSO/TMAO reductase YedYZ molybdopterin-dependent catalytic subunit